MLRKKIAALLITAMLSVCMDYGVMGAELFSDVETGVCTDSEETELPDDQVSEVQEETETDAVGGVFSSGSEEDNFFSGEEPEAEVFGDAEDDFLAAGETRTEKVVTAESGCTDEEFQKLLDLNANGEYHLIVEVPSGEYRFYHTVYVHSYTTIRAASDARIVKMERYGSLLEAKLTDDDGGYDGCTDITIEGGIWDSLPVRDMPKGTESFRFIHCSNIHLKKVVLCNVPNGSHLVVLAGTQNVSINNCKFYGYGKENRELTAKEAIQLDVAHDINIVPTHQNVAWDDLPCRNVVISGCEFYDFPRGIGSHTAIEGRYHTNVTIRGNYFHDLSDSAVRLFGYCDAVVENNTFYNTAIAIRAYTFSQRENAWLAPIDGDNGTLPDCYDLVISGNNIVNTRNHKELEAAGDAICITGYKGRLVTGVLITDNHISDCGRFGIYLREAGASTVIGNDISAYGLDSDKSTSGICVSLSSMTEPVSILQNTIDGQKCSRETDGIRLVNAPCTVVLQNKISNSSGNGIYVYKSSDCVIGTDAQQYNVIQASKARGIYFVSSSGGSAKNNVIDAAGDGIAAYRSSEITLQGNAITSRKNGIYMMSGTSSSILKKNCIHSAGGNGIRLTKSGRTVVSYNTIKKYGVKTSKGYGIYVTNSGSASGQTMTKIIYNSVTGYGNNKKRDAIRVEASPFTSISYNQIKMTGASGNGVWISGSKSSVITKNKIVAKKAVNGICINNSSGAQVTSNTISGTSEKKAVVVVKSAKCINAKNKIK